MTRRSGFAAALLCLVLATASACGGGDETAATTAGGTTDAVPRAGYFGAEQSAVLNPVLATLSAAGRTVDGEDVECDDEAVRLFEAGVPPRRAIACHLRLNSLMRNASRELGVAVDGIEGDFRPECARELVRYRATVARLQAAWQRALDRWQAYGRGEAVPGDQITAAGRRARGLAREFLVDNTAGEALSRACYTAEDRAAAARS